VKLSVVVINGKYAGRSVRLKGSKLSIGRAPDCQLRPDSDSISRHHCVILVENGQAIVRDLGSRNGTLVNGEKIEGDRPLANADRLTVGRLELEERKTVDAAEKTETRNETEKADHVTSEEDKEAARRTRAVVGVSKTAQGKRVSATSSGAAAEALKKFFR